MLTILKMVFLVQRIIFVMGKTNFLLMLTDDLGYADVSYRNGVTHTVNLDKLSRDSSTMILDNFHSAALICSPSRAGFYSARYPAKSCIINIYDTTKIRKPNHVRAGFTTFAQDAKRANYATLFFGKWHLGNPAQIPLGNYGFDQMWISDSGNQFRSGKYVNVIGNKRTSIPSSYSSSSSFISEHFSTFIQTLPAPQPFLVVMAFNEAHHPARADPAIYQMCFKNMTLCAVNSSIIDISSYSLVNWISVIKGLDINIGKILKSLEDSGRTQETFILFSSDNGPELNYLFHTYGSSAPFVGMKRSRSEGGSRFAALVSWPEVIKSNFESDSLTSLLDIRPTIQAILQQENPLLNLAFPDLDGVSFLPLLQQPEFSFDRNKGIFLCQLPVAHTSVCHEFAIYLGEYKLFYPEMILVHPSTDVKEKINLAKNPSFANITQTLLKTGLAIYSDIRHGFRAARC